MKICRRVEFIDELCITTNENILVVDNGCDQTIININSFIIKSFAGVLFNVGGALHDMKSSQLELVNDAYTLVHLNDRKVIFKINQCFLDRNPAQTEALLQPHQVRAFGIMVDDCASCHMRSDGIQGSQCITIGDVTIPMLFDGWKCYFRISKPSQLDMDKYEIIELTNERAYEPQGRRFSRRIPSSVGVSIAIWRERLGFPVHEVATNTLANTTNMVQTMEAETRDYMRNHKKTRVWALRPRRINDTCYSDTFFSSVVSIRKYRFLSDS